jgi:adhesin transport system outer membrane protein
MLSTARAETLQEAVELTLKTNPDVLIESARRESTTETLTQAKGGYMPKIDISTGGGRERKDNATVQSTYGSSISQKKQERSLSLTQMLFDGFATASEVARQQARTESADHKLAATSEQTALKAVEAFLEVLRLSEILNLTKENLLAHQRTFDQIKVRVTGGMARKSDLDQIDARMALAGSNLTAAEANLDVAAINYKLVVGAMPGELAKPKSPGDELMPGTPDEATYFAIQNSRFLKSADADVAAAKAQHQSSKSGLYPRLDLEMGRSDSFTANGVDSQKDLTNYVMLRMRYNIFRGGADTGRVSETRHQSREAQEVRNRAERQIEQSVRLAWSAHRAARDRLPNLRKHAESSFLTREAYTKQFSLGQRTLLDLLDTENEYFTATTNGINGHYVELFSRYRLLAELSQLLEVVGISHDTPRQDIAFASSSPADTGTANVPANTAFSVLAPTAAPAPTAPVAADEKTDEMVATSPKTPAVPALPVAAEPPVVPDTPKDPVTAVAASPAAPVAPVEIEKPTAAATRIAAPALPQPVVAEIKPGALVPASPPMVSSPIADDFMEAPVDLVYSSKIGAPNAQPGETAPAKLNPENEFMDAAPELIFDSDAPSAIQPPSPAVKTAPSAATPEPSAPRSWLIEIDGVFERTVLTATWKRLQKKFAAELDDKSLFPRRLDTADGSRYRLFIAHFSSEQDAAALCKTLTANQVQCRSAPVSALVTPQAPADPALAAAPTKP